MNKKIMKSRASVWGLMIGLISATMCGTLSAANYYWDIGSAAGYQPGNGTWETSAFWTLNGTTLTTWPGESTNNAYICTSTGTNVVTISSPVGVNQLGLGWNGSAKTDNNWVTLTNSSITVGAGGIIVDGNKTAAIYSDIVLATNQTWDIRAVALPVYGNVTENGNGFGITKTGASTLSLYGINYFSGDFVQGAGAVTVYSSSGLPLGSGSLSISNKLTLNITPVGSGNAVALLGGTNGNNTLTFDGYTRIYINKGTQSSVTYTFGKASDSGIIFNRIGKGTLSVGNSTTVNPGTIGDVNGNIIVANGATGVPIHNGMVDAYIIAETMGSQWAFDFLKYDAVNGLVNLTYDGAFTGISSGINDNTKKYRVANANYPIITNNTAIYALNLQQTSTLTLSNNAVLSIGNGVQPAGLIVHNGPIRSAGDSPASKIDFGTSEGIIYNGQNAFIATPIAGSAGVTFNAGGGNTIALTLSAANTFTGPTTILYSGVTLANGGSLAAGSPVTVCNGGVLNVNNGGTVNGTVDNYGTMTVNGGSAPGIITNNGALTIGGSSALTLGTINGIAGSGSVTDNNTFPHSLTFANGSSFASLTPGVGATITLSNGGGVTSFGNFLMNSALPAFTVTLDDGTWNATTMGSNSGTSRFGGILNINNGAVLTTASARFAAHGTYNVGGTGTGTINMSGSWSAEGSSSLPFTYNIQNGGTINSSASFVISLSSSSYPAIGSGMLNTINLYSGGKLFLSGGASLTLGSTQAITGSETNVFNIAGGKLLVSGTLSQAAPTAGHDNIFNWTGGQISAGTITTANLAGGALNNSAGTLAPGDLGTAGRTTITGSYSAAPTATLAMDIGGTTQANAFQVASGAYDYLLVNNGSTFLAGKLMVSLINGYSPASHTTAFTIINNTGTGAGVTGTFANLNGKILPLTDGYRLFTNVTQSATQVILSGYVINEYLSGTWDSTSTWSQGVIPGNQDYAAYFGALASSFLPDVGTRTLKGLVFASANSFTLGGTALTLQGDAFINVTAGNHTISVPIALSNATEIAVATACADTLRECDRCSERHQDRHWHVGAERGEYAGRADHQRRHGQADGRHDHAERADAFRGHV